MARRKISAEGESLLDKVLGYLNFSSGTPDSQFLTSLNGLFELASAQNADTPTYEIVGEWIRNRLDELANESTTFKNAEQASGIMDVAFRRIPSVYREFHRDLLFHQPAEFLFGPFFMGRVCEATLQQGPPWDDADRLVHSAIKSLNDYIGYRPVAVLENRKIEPYPNEWVRPIPIYIRDAGVASGPHQKVVTLALELVNETAPSILRAACFVPENLMELAVDPRAYDFDHPANKRPNYHFGQWDPNQIDNRGYYTRFVVQQVTLNALMNRVENPPKRISADEILFEAASVLAGTMLMASGISGSGPDTHDSSVTLTSLLPDIAAYRDEFYIQLFDRIDGDFRKRLEEEAAQKRQPFGGARQHLNAQLARCRASQLEHVHLAMIFARMGYADAAIEQANVVPTASARLQCRIDACLLDSNSALDRGELEKAADLLVEAVELVKRAIDSGAIVDPWNILGFDAQFSLFPALENSIHDHRADELIDLIERIFAFYSQVWSEAAAVDNRELCDKISVQFHELTDWWRKYAVHQVGSVEATDALDAYRAAEHVAGALNLWHKGGASAGDVGFWAPHAEMFDSPTAYALVVEALLERRDFVASMALLIHWLSQADRVGLEQSDRSFHFLVETWLLRLHNVCSDESDDSLDLHGGWKLTKKLFDYLEANAEEYWRTPHFDLSRSRPKPNGELATGVDEESAEGDDDLYNAAYEDVVYRDSTDDGVEGEVFDYDSSSDDELELESRRIADRLAFLTTMSRLWTLVATGPFVVFCNSEDESQEQVDFEEVFRHWIADAARNHRDLLGLLDDVSAHPLPLPSGDHDSMIEYDRRRVSKESLLDRIVITCVEASAAVRHLLAAATAYPVTVGEAFQSPERDEDQLQIVEVCAAMIRGEITKVRLHWPDLIQALAEQPLLYVPLNRGGDPGKIVATRVRQQAIQDLLAWLPRLGLLSETRQLLETAREMEREHPVGVGAVTEFDELFKIGYKSLVGCLVDSAEKWNGDKKSSKKATENLVDCLESATESLLVNWLAHSRTLRLSVLEKVKDDGPWDSLVAFIQRFGKELFTQRFFNLGNLRAILHQGVEQWLEQAEEEVYDESLNDLLSGLESDDVDRNEAIDNLTLVLEAIVENYGEYRDYNSTTTQSDRGELLYMLLDFLRLRTDYDRVAWNLKPVVWAHEILVRRGHANAARSWRRTLTDRIGEESAKYLARLTELQKKYAMSMPTVADRIGERFVRPMHIDRIRALIEPVIQGVRDEEPPAEFEMLQKETEVLTSEPTGVGLDVPPWLIALEDEVEDVLCSERGINTSTQLELIPQRPLSFEEVRQQIDEWTNREY